MAVALCTVAALSLARTALAGFPCHQRYLEKYNYPGCAVDSRADLPSIDLHATYAIYVAQHALSAGGHVAEMLGITHSKFLVHEASATGPAAQFSLEFDAVHFSLPSFIPNIDVDGNLHWDTLAAVSWRPERNDSQWLANALIIPMGNASGHVMEQWFQWVITWKRAHTEYDIYSIWDRTDVLKARRDFNDSMCHTFIEDSLRTLHSLGARLDQSEPICRVYAVFISETGYQPVDMEDAAVRQEVVAFYRFLRSASAEVYGELGDFLSRLKDLFEWNRAGRHVYIHWNRTYWRASVSWPFVALNFKQRMVLPWQDPRQRRRGECGWIQGRAATDPEALVV